MSLLTKRVQIEQLAEAVLKGEALLARSLTQDFLQSHPTLSTVPQPQTADKHILAISAALLELFAVRSHQKAPAWRTASVGPVPEPVYLLKAAQQMKRLRELCRAESPEPLRKRRFYAPPDYLEFV